MDNAIHTFTFQPDWMELTNEISQVDRFDASWSSIEKREGQSLKQLKLIATVRSVGASTRIEGSKMTDKEVELLIKNLDVSKLEDRDQQEVAGYFKVLDIISESFRDIDITEGNIKNLHKALLSYSTKDEWHRGDYKQHSNVVQATHPDGEQRIVFQTTEPGFATEEAMRGLIGWYTSDNKTHALIKSAIFVYDFLSIHPFQDGNGRMSRLLATLLLLKHGYSWIQYVSFEHEIESRKAEYYKELMQCQSKRPGEDVYPWVTFFLDCLSNIQNLLMKKVHVQAGSDKMSPREKMIYVLIENHPGVKSGEIAERLDVPLPTIKRILANMVANKLLVRHGIGAGTNYTIESIISIRKDLIFKLTGAKRNKEFTINHAGSFIEIKKIILTPLFDWIRPDEWARELFSQGLYLQISCQSKKNDRFSRQFYTISSYNTHDLLNPVFTLFHPIKLPLSLWENLWGEPNNNEYPITIEIDLFASLPDVSFDVLIVYDEA